MITPLSAHCPPCGDDRFLYSSAGEQNKHLEQLIRGFLYALDGNGFPFSNMQNRLAGVLEGLEALRTLTTTDPLCRTERQGRKAYIQGRPATTEEYERALTIATMLLKVVKLLKRTDYAHPRRFRLARHKLLDMVKTAESWTTKSQQNAE
jgi:hypothetical protein